MNLFNFAVLGIAGYGAYRYLNRQRMTGSRVAFADGEPGHGPGFVKVRNAGPDAMASDLRHWDNVDQASDESFPASDPAGSNRFT